MSVMAPSLAPSATRGRRIPVRRLACGIEREVVEAPALEHRLLAWRLNPRDLTWMKDSVRPHFDEGVAQTLLLERDRQARSEDPLVETDQSVHVGGDKRQVVDVVEQLHDDLPHSDVARNRAARSVQVDGRRQPPQRATLAVRRQLRPRLGPAVSVGEPGADVAHLRNGRPARRCFAARPAPVAGAELGHSLAGDKGVVPTRGIADRSGSGGDDWNCRPADAHQSRSVAAPADRGPASAVLHARGALRFRCTVLARNHCCAAPSGFALRHHSDEHSDMDGLHRGGLACRTGQLAAGVWRAARFRSNRLGHRRNYRSGRDGWTTDTGTLDHGGVGDPHPICRLCPLHCGGLAGGSGQPSGCTGSIHGCPGNVCDLLAGVSRARFGAETIAHGWPVAIIVLTEIIGLLLLFHLARKHGGSFTAQANYVAVVAGSLIGPLLFDQQVNATAIIGILMLVFALRLSAKYP